MNGDDHMNKYCIGRDFTIIEAIEIIDKSKDRVAIVMTHDNRVIGVISQGDIIRAILSGKDLHSRIESLVRPNFYYLNTKDLEKAYQLFKKHKITLLPVVDEEFHLIDIICMDDIYNYMEAL